MVFEFVPCCCGVWVTNSVCIGCCCCCCMGACVATTYVCPWGLVASTYCVVVVC